MFPHGSLRQALLVLVGLAPAVLGVAGCFTKADVDVTTLRCAGDKNCPDGYVCRDKQGSPPLGICVQPGAAQGSDASPAPDAQSVIFADAPAGADAVEADARGGIPEGDAGIAADLPSGPVAATLAIDPGSTTFPTTAVGGESAGKVFTISNRGGSTSGALTASLLGNTFAISADDCTGVPLAAQASCEITVKFRPTTAGDASATLEVSGNPGGSVSASLQGNAIVPGALTITPAEVTFPETPVGSRSDAVTLTVANSGGTTAGTTTALQASFTESDASTFVVSNSTCGETLAPGGTCLVTIAFSPTSAGSKTASLTATASPGGSAAAGLSAQAKAICSTTPDGLCPSGCKPLNDIDCGLADKAFCSTDDECKSGSCKFFTCCGTTWSCPECMNSAHCTETPTKPVCDEGACRSCEADSDCSGSTPACDRTGACIADAKLTWFPTGSGLAGKTVVGLTRSGNNLLASVMGDGVYISANKGSTWTASSEGLESATSGPNRSMLVTGGHVLIAGSFYGVYRSSDDGVTWTARNEGLQAAGSSSVEFLAVSGSYVMAGVKSQLARTSDYGDTWEVLPGSYPWTSDLSAMAVAGGTLYVGTNGSGAWASRDNGATWAEVNTGLDERQIQSLAANDQYVFAGGVGGGIYRLPVGGSSWTKSNADDVPRKVGGALNVTTIAFSGSTLYASRASTGVLASMDGGLTWWPANRGLPEVHVETVLVESDFIYVATLKDGVYRSPLP